MRHIESPPVIVTGVRCSAWPLLKAADEAFRDCTQCSSSVYQNLFLFWNHLICNCWILSLTFKKTRRSVLCTWAHLRLKQSILGCEATKWCCRWRLHGPWVWRVRGWEWGPTGGEKNKTLVRGWKRHGKEKKRANLTTLAEWSHDPETMRFSPLVWLQSTEYTFTHTQTHTHAR